MFGDAVEGGRVEDCRSSAYYSIRIYLVTFLGRTCDGEADVRLEGQLLYDDGVVTQSKLCALFSTLVLRGMYRPFKRVVNRQRSSHMSAELRTNRSGTHWSCAGTVLSAALVFISNGHGHGYSTYPL